MGTLGQGSVLSVLESIQEMGPQAIPVSNVIGLPTGNYAAVVDPTADDDILLSYEIGSLWINRALDKMFVCTDNTEGSALWEITTGAAAIAALVVGTHNQATPVHSPASVGAAAYASGATLPTGDAIVTRQFFYLTANDGVAKCAPGLYMHDGIGWICLMYNGMYALGNTTAAPDYTVIPGCIYSVIQDQNITTPPVITFTRPGICCFVKSGAFAIAGKPTMAERTSKEITTDAWTPAASALSLWTVQDTGTLLLSQASSLV